MVQATIQDATAGVTDDSYDIIKKPRTMYSNKILRQVAGVTDLKKRKESLSMSVIKLKAKSNATLGDDKHDSGRLFQKSGSFSDNEKLNFAKSCNIIRQPINFSSPRGKQMKMDLLSSSQEEGEDQGSGLQDKLDTIKQEDEGMSSDEPEDDEEEKEDSTSGEEDDSSIDADMQGDDFETEDQIYQRILAN